MPYDISSRDYLTRARMRLADGTQEALFYAAYELRCGIEARMAQYLEVWEHVSERRKKGWRISDLAKGLEEAFSSNPRIVRWAVRDRTTNQPITFFYYTPVTDQLKRDGEKLGNYLHSKKAYNAPDDEYWAGLKAELTAIAGRLQDANTGTLLGPPLMRPNTKLADTKLELPPDSKIDEVMKAMREQELVIDVSYHDNLPVEFEAEALVWRFD